MHLTSTYKRSTTARHTAGFFFAKIAKNAKKPIDKIRKMVYNIDKERKTKGGTNNGKEILRSAAW